MPKKKASKSWEEYELTPSSATPQPKKTAKKSPTVKRPTDLSSIRKLGSRFGKRMPFGNSKPKPKKTGRTQSKWRWFSTSLTNEGGTLTTASAPSWTVLEPQTFSGKTTTSSSQTSGYLSVGTTRPTPVLKSLLRKFKFYIALAGLLVLAWLGAREYLDNWVAIAFFVVSLIWAVEQLTGRDKLSR